jgi:hypothetical protein
MLKNFSHAFVFLMVLTAPAAASLQALFAPDAELWPRWSAHDENATANIDHDAWSAFLFRYRQLGVDGIARIQYENVTPAHRERLNAYIDKLAEVEISSFAREQQFAFWVNLYNALTVQLILENYPVQSIGDIDISPGLFSDGPWGAVLISIEGEDITLNDIEHRILRPIWQDSRVHYVVNCASIGCPNIGARALSADELEPMLDEAARAYINSPRGVRYDSGALIVSRIYDWFHEDFGENQEDILDHLRRYAEPDMAERLMAADRIDGYEYDWSLNDAP